MAGRFGNRSCIVSWRGSWAHLQVCTHEERECSVSVVIVLETVGQTIGSLSTESEANLPGPKRQRCLYVHKVTTVTSLTLRPTGRPRSSQSYVFRDEMEIIVPPRSNLISAFPLPRRYRQHLRINRYHFNLWHRKDRYLRFHRDQIAAYSKAGRINAYICCRRI